ncbi:MAG: hypothetical protein EB078_12420 [Proteobacteria bacterium]|nr:hypothetical protein [Pseudomonadota bacterium]NDC25685.1 hypothetical protein [Pseudomonadota bacterium]NDD05703.1 hypothetical protein [Pseudomonadota bacterium]NDG28108.1 hypothetical protein [Pseudomonadota bacterium]
MKNLAFVAVAFGMLIGSVSQAQYVVPVYPAPIVAYPAPVVTYPAPVVPVYPVAPNCTWVSVPVSAWQWVQGPFGAWRLAWVTTYQNQLVCR